MVLLSSRARYSGEAQGICDVVLPHASSPSWFKYAEQDRKNSLKPAVLKRFPELWRGFRRLHGNLSFSQQQMKAAMVLVWKAREAWDLTDAQGDEQTTVLAKRLRCALRHIAQAGRKAKPPRWYEDLFGDSGTTAETTEPKGEGPPPEEAEEDEESEECNEGEECDEEEERIEGKMCNEGSKDGKKLSKDGEKCSKDGEKCSKDGEKRSKDGKMCSKDGKKCSKDGEKCNEGEDWPFIGWDSELEMAYRAKAQGGRKAARQTSKVLVEPPAGEGLFMQAKFNDGKMYELTDLTVEDYKSMIAARKEKKDSRCKVLWSSTHAVTGLEVSIRPRPDRQPLLTLKHAGCQVCQVPVQAFENVTAALKFFKVIGHIETHLLQHGFLSRNLAAF